jgi:hypothetical protein
MVQKGPAMIWVRSSTTTPDKAESVVIVGLVNPVSLGETDRKP